MGTTGTHRPHGQSMLEFFKEEFGGGRHEVLEVSTVKRKVCYVLMRRKAYNHFGFHYPERLHVVTCLITFCPKSYYNLYYKDITETMGPCESDCPERFLKAIAPYPPENIHAWEWRQRCLRNIERRRAKPKLAVGDIIEFKRTIRFTDGVERGKFCVTSTKPLRFVDENGYRVRLRQDMLNFVENYTHIPVISPTA